MTAEDLLTRTLREVTEHTDYPTTPMATVAAHARTGRVRRRRTASLAAAAAVAAVAVPSAVWLGHSPGTSPGPSHELSSGPTTGPTSLSTSTSPSPLVAIEGSPRGAAPGVDYIDGDTYVDMGGARTTAPVLRKAPAVTLTRGGLIVALRSTLPDDRIGDLQVVTDSGDQGLGCGSDRFAISDDRVESAYWAMDSCTTGSAGRLYTGVNNTMGEAGPSYVATPAGRVVQPVGFTSQGVVTNVGRPDFGQDLGVWIYGPQGGPTRIPGLATAGGTDQTHDLVAGQSAADPDTGIIVHATTGVPVSYVPSWILGQFSPDGKYVLGVQPMDGEPNGYAVFDAATGDQVTELGPMPLGGFRILQIGWDSNDTVLAVATGGATNDDAVVRFDLHNHMTLATTPKPTPDQSFPVYRLATRP
jgi:hypothetical protein